MAVINAPWRIWLKTAKHILLFHIVTRRMNLTVGGARVIVSCDCGETIWEAGLDENLRTILLK